MKNITATLLCLLIFVTSLPGAFASSKKPIVKAGNRQAVKEQTQVTLNGSVIYGGGNITGIIWRQIKGTHVDLNGQDTLNPSFTAPTITKAVSLGFKLTVNYANTTASATTTVAVAPVNASPIANAGENKTVGLAVPITLDGSASNDNIDGSIVNWQWKQTAGPTVKLSNAKTPNPTFITPAKLKGNVDYVDLAFKLTVTDNEKAKTTSKEVHVWVTTQNKGQNINPIAKTGASQRLAVNVDSTVTLDGSGSKDPDGEITRYQWEQTTSGTSVQIANSSDKITSFIAPATAGKLGFKLTVTDNKNSIASTDIVINVREKLTPPKLEGTQLGQQQNLNWTKIAGATAYRVCYSDNVLTIKPGDDDRVLSCLRADGGTPTEQTVQGTSTTISGLQINRTYHFVVIAHNDAMEIPSNDLQATLPGTLNDTGISKCATEKTNGLVCPQSSYPGQDADYGLDAGATVDLDGFAGFMFKKISSTGAAATKDDWSCVKDSVTQLLWERKTGTGLHNPSNVFTSLPTDDKNYAATTETNDATKFIAAVNNANFCGQNNWRLPTISELLSIVHYGTGAPDPAIDSTFFSDVPAGVNGNNNYRSSTIKTAATTTDDKTQYLLDYYAGTYAFTNRQTGQAIRLVSGESNIPFNRYTLSTDGSEVTDLGTGLIWQRCTLGSTWKSTACTGNVSKYNFKDALLKAKALSTSTKKWRLPNIKELDSLAIFKQNIDQSLDNVVFPGNAANAYWSSSPVYNDAALAWAYSFAVQSKPVQKNKSLATPDAVVRLVRDQ
jgi:hypothetical protein